MPFTGALSQDRLLQARADEHVRLYFANAGPRQVFIFYQIVLVVSYHSSLNF